MPKGIAEQVVVITGASSGIGLATAHAAARRGARVVLSARNERDLEHAVGEIRRQGGDAVSVPADVTEYDQVERLARSAVETYGRIDTWVNNAGVELFGTFREVSLEDMRQVMEVIYWGNVHGARVALPLLEQTGGALICVGSALSDRGVPLQTGYCAAKHAVKGWLDGLRVELRHEGSKVRVTLVKPSSINTPLFSKAKTYMGVQPRPLPPVYEPELVAEAILRAAEGNERDVYAGGAGKALGMGERISPKLLDLQQRRSMFRQQKTSWPETPDSPNNLYAPLPYDGGLRGEFTKKSRSRSRYQELAAHSTAASFAGAAALGLAALATRKLDDGALLLPALLGAGALMLTGKGALSAGYQG